MVDENQSADIEDTISKHGKVLETEGATTLSSISGRLDQVELLIEQLGKSSDLIVKLSDYISDLRDETQSIRRIRFWSVWLAVGFIAFDLLMLVISFYQHPFYMALFGPSFQIAVFVSSVTAAVVLISVILKGAFRTAGDKGSDDVLPPHLKEAYEALKTAIGK